MADLKEAAEREWIEGLHNEWLTPVRSRLSLLRHAFRAGWRAALAQPEEGMDDSELMAMATHVCDEMGVPADAEHWNPLVGALREVAGRAQPEEQIGIPGRDADGDARHALSLTLGPIDEVLTSEDFEDAVSSVATLLREARSQPEEGWVSVDERHPTTSDADEDGDVWVYRPGAKPCKFGVSYFHDGLGDWKAYTHWHPRRASPRPLPPRPEE